MNCFLTQQCYGVIPGGKPAVPLKAHTNTIHDKSVLAFIPAKFTKFKHCLLGEKKITYSRDRNFLIANPVNYLSSWIFLFIGTTLVKKKDVYLPFNLLRVNFT